MSKVWSLLLAALVTVNLTSRSSSASQIDPTAAFEMSQQNRLNGGKLISLYFCPRWFMAIYTGQPYEGFSTVQRLSITIGSAGFAYLNSQGNPASLDIISLNLVDDETAKTAWGARSNSDGSMTCDLITQRLDPEIDIYHLDLRFKGHKVSEYRIRGIGISNAEWVHS